MHLGQFEEAIGYLNKYTLTDEILAPQAKGLIGDANVELGDNAEVASSSTLKLQRWLTTPSIPPFT